MARGGRDPRNPGVSPFKAGLIAAVLILVFSFFGFSRYNPFAHPFKLYATFHSANNLQPKSPVRIAGIDVGKVTDVQPLKSGSGHVVVADNPPFLYGRNFTSLGSLSQVDSALRKDGITP